MGLSFSTPSKPRSYQFLYIDLVLVKAAARRSWRKCIISPFHFSPHQIQLHLDCLWWPKIKSTSQFPSCKRNQFQSIVVQGDHEIADHVTFLPTQYILQICGLLVWWISCLAWLVVRIDKPVIACFIITNKYKHHYKSQISLPKVSLVTTNHVAFCSSLHCISYSVIYKTPRSICWLFTNIQVIEDLPNRVQGLGSCGSRNSRTTKRNIPRVILGGKPSTRMARRSRADSEDPGQSSAKRQKIQTCEDDDSEMRSYASDNVTSVSTKLPYCSPLKDLNCS